MKTWVFRLSFFTCLLCCVAALGAVRYVDVNSTNAVSRFTDWSTAATNIQDAIDAADVGDVVLVADGVYNQGGSVPYGSLTNRVAITKAVTVQSLNGPLATFIVGYQMPSKTNGDAAIRCVYMTNDAVLVGFTLTNGAVRTGAGRWAEMSGGGVGCESTNATITNCVFVGNAAATLGGGGVTYGTLYNCTLSGNVVIGSGGFGGAACRSVLNDCLVLSNRCELGGGLGSAVANRCRIVGNISPGACGEGAGAYGGTLNDCVLLSNSAQFLGGAACNSTLNRCLVLSNSAGVGGGGASGGTLNNCLVVSNSSARGGGGSGVTLNNCTVIGNSASIQGGGVYNTQGNSCINSILYYNSAPSAPDALLGFGVTPTSCCTPIAVGQGTFTNQPAFADVAGGNYHLQSTSPCINSGNNAYAAGTTDLDGNPRISGGTIDVGAYEFQNPASPISYVWLQQYGFPCDGSGDGCDSDGDGLSNWQEWIAGTDPTNGVSALRLVTATNSATGLAVVWQSVSTRNYFVQRCANAAACPGFVTVATNVPGTSGTTKYTDLSATGPGPFFYRVGIQQ